MTSVQIIDLSTNNRWVAFNNSISEIHFYWHYTKCMRYCLWLSLLFLLSLFRTLTSHDVVSLPKFHIIPVFIYVLRLWVIQCIFCIVKEWSGLKRMWISWKLCASSRQRLLESCHWVSVYQHYSLRSDEIHFNYAECVLIKLVFNWTFLVHLFLTHSYAFAHLLLRPKNKQNEQNQQQQSNRIVFAPMEVHVSLYICYCSHELCFGL